MSFLPGTLKKKVFVFCRPYLVEDFEANIEQLRGAFEFRFLTDGEKRGISDTRARFYQRLTSAKCPLDFTDAEELDILERCRYLRNIPQHKALSILRSMASVLAEELDAYRPNVVLSHMVDDYTTHLLAELARRRGIVYVGFAYSYFPGKVQITQFGYGVPLDVREPSDIEVEDVLAKISERTFRQNYLQGDSYTRLRHLVAMMRYRTKQVVFGLKARLQNDPLQMHYAGLPFVAERRNWRDFPSESDFHGDWRHRLDGIKDQSTKPILYFPLGYFPEATIDYWIVDRRVLQYQQLVLDICLILSPYFRVVVKEHLHMLGARGTAFYREVRNIPGVVSIPPLEFSNDVLALSAVVLMGAGSIGVEAFIRGKPVVTFSNTSYWFSRSNSAYLDLADIQNWPALIEAKRQEYTVPDEGEKLEFIRQCLRSTMRQQRPGSRWPICNTEDLRNLLHVAISNGTLSVDKGVDGILVN